MLITVRDDILETLTNLQKFQQVDVWQGDLEELLVKAKKLPSAFVALAAGTFQSVKTMPPGAATLRMDWDVILFFNSLRGASETTVQGYELIEVVTAKAADRGLTGLVTAGGLLWPTDLELLASSSGVTVYRIGFTIERDMT